MVQKKRRRQWSDDEKISIVGQTRIEGVSVAQVARRYAVNANQIHQWIRNPRFNPEPDEDSNAAFFPVEVAPCLDLGRVMNRTPLPAGEPSGALNVSITMPGGVQVDIRDCKDIDLICRLVRGLA